MQIAFSAEKLAVYNKLCRRVYLTVDTELIFKRLTLL